MPTESSANQIGPEQTGEYRVRLEAFDGPLDLLLYLIRRSEVDIHDISRITDQYLAFLDGVDRIDIETAGEFLVLAATLMEIKARILGAESLDTGERREQTESTDGDEDPRADLVRQLLDYKAFRDAAAKLEDRWTEWRRRFATARAGFDPATGDDEPQLDLEDLQIADLARAFAEICSSVNFDRLGDHEVAYDDTPIELHAADIMDQLDRGGAGEGGMSLRRIFEGRSRGEMIGLFMATLELVRQQRITVLQGEDPREILIARREISEGAAAPGE
jgi:segregation and condensation protein A